MTLDEKVGQLTESAGIVMPGLASEKPDNAIAAGKVGSVLWLIDVKEINRLQHIAVEKSRLHHIEGGDTTALLALRNKPSSFFSASGTEPFSNFGKNACASLIFQPT